MDIGQFLELLSPVAVYDSGYQLALFVASAITPFLLALAIGIRTLETQVDALTSGTGRWGRFVRDMGIWITVLAVYFGLALMINEVFTSLYRSFAAKGSLSLLMEQFSSLLTAIEAAGEEEGGFTDSLVNLLGSPVLGISYFVYYVSLILVAFVGIFLQLAHAIAYSFVISWGLVAIPMSITTSFKLLGPWAKFTGIVLIWPIIHYIAFALFTPLFVKAATFFVDGDAASVNFDQAQVYLLYTIVNFIACALIVAAPFIAQTLISSGSITGLVAPFAAAGMGAASSVLRMGKAQTLAGGQQVLHQVRRSANEGVLGRSVQRVAEAIVPSLNAAPHPARQAGGPMPVQPHSVSASFSPSTQPAQSGTAPASTPAFVPTAPVIPTTPTASSNQAVDKAVTGAAGDEQTVQKRQARRGAILDRLHKKGSVNLKGRKT